MNTFASNTSWKLILLEHKPAVTLLSYRIINVVLGHFSALYLPKIISEPISCPKSCVIHVGSEPEKTKQDLPLSGLGSVSIKSYLFIHLFSETSCVGPRFTAELLVTDRGSSMTCLTNWWPKPRNCLTPQSASTTSGTTYCVMTELKRKLCKKFFTFQI